MFPLKNTFQERSFCVTPLVLTKKLRVKEDFLALLLFLGFTVTVIQRVY